MSMKTALVHDYLITHGGAEKVLESIYSLYPGKLFTLINSGLWQNRAVETSFLQKLPFVKYYYRHLLPFFPFAIEQFDLSNYDLVISSSHAVAKGVLTSSDQLHICYCHTPMRYAWDLYFSYMKQLGVLANPARFFMHRLRKWDVLSSNRVDHFIANSHYVAKRIEKIYRRKTRVVYPPVRTQFFTPEGAKREDFYLTAGRFVSYKKIDLIVEAFAQMPDKKLVIIGDGPNRKMIKQKATANIELLGYLDDEMMRSYMRKAKAFVFMAEEDFGIMPVEAQACAAPVIAYKKGGAIETVIENKTGVFVDKQTPEKLIETIQNFEQKEFDPDEIRSHAEHFSEKRFKREFSQTVQNLCNSL